MYRTLEVFEHETLRVTDHGPGLRRREFEQLIEFNHRNGDRYFKVGHNELKTTEFVGYVEVGDLSIEILPKADKTTSATPARWREGLLAMLRAVFGMRLPLLPDGSQGVTRRHLLDLIARAFVVELDVLVREGLAKGYRTTTSNGAVFRGRLNIAAHLRENLVRADRFFVEYQTFDHDIAVNQILAAALDTLSGCALSSSVRSAVDSRIASLPEVTTAGVTSETCDRIRLHRGTHRYERALSYARMILADEGPRLRHGRRRVFSLLFDMNALWERYIATLIRRIAPPHIAIDTQSSRTFWSSPHEVAKVRPDIVVRSIAEVRTGKALLVIDTKWKVPGTRPADDDLKQMFVYNELFGTTRSVLVYPRTQASLAASGKYASKEHSCEHAYVGALTSDPWSEHTIERDLVRLIEQHVAQRT